MHPIKDYKYFYLYKTTNIINGKIYIGVHASNKLKNKYLGSGVYLKEAIKKYGRENFHKEIISIYESYDEVLAAERSAVTEEFIKRRDTYNVEIGGNGGHYWTEELREKMSEAKKGSVPWNKGIKTGHSPTEEFKEYLSKKMRGSGNHMYGKNVADIMTPEANAERLRKISERNRKPKQSTEKLHDYASKRFFIVNEQGQLRHCIDDNDPRILSGEFQRGRTWKDF